MHQAFAAPYRTSFTKLRSASVRPFYAKWLTLSGLPSSFTKFSLSFFGTTKSLELYIAIRGTPSEKKIYWVLMQTWYTSDCWIQGCIEYYSLKNDAVPCSMQGPDKACEIHFRLVSFMGSITHLAPSSFWPTEALYLHASIESHTRRSLRSMLQPATSFSSPKPNLPVYMRA